MGYVQDIYLRYTDKCHEEGQEPLEFKEWIEAIDEGLKKESVNNDRYRSI